mgnify:CR=1 FL=1
MLRLLAPPALPVGRHVWIRQAPVPHEVRDHGGELRGAVELMHQSGRRAIFVEHVSQPRIHGAVFGAVRQPAMRRRGPPLLGLGGPFSGEELKEMLSQVLDVHVPDEPGARVVKCEPDAGLSDAISAVGESREVAQDDLVRDPAIAVAAVTDLERQVRVGSEEAP